MTILLIEPYFSGSHQQWAEEWRRYSKHRIDILSLPGRHWKWRMLGGAVEMAQRVLQLKEKPDLLLVSDMLDLPTFLGLIRNHLAGVPIALYFHENQLTYPWAPNDPDSKLKRNHQYGFINYTSALAADMVLFNSAFHRQSFLQGAENLLQQLPDYQGMENIEKIRAKSRVLPLGLDLKSLDTDSEPKKNTAPLILWNHRWEYDKNPEGFFQLLFKLQEEGYDFRVAVLGAQFRKSPPVFDKAKKQLAGKIIHFGYAPDREAYTYWLHRADILPVTSRQDFFGISTVEAIYCGCYPLLPNRLAYPEHIPDSYRSLFLYEDESALYARLKQLLLAFKHIKELIHLQDFVARYDWSTLAKVYDQLMEQSTK